MTTIRIAAAVGLALLGARGAALSQTPNARTASGVNPDTTVSRKPGDTTAAKKTVPVTVPVTDTMVPPLDSVRVLRAERYSGLHAGQKADTAAGIGDIISVQVRDLKSLLIRSHCRTLSGTPINGCKPAPIVLFLDGREMVGLGPESGAPKADSPYLQFHLERNTQSDEAWADLLGAPMPFTQNFFLRPVSVSVGLAEGYALPTDITVVNGESSFRLIRFREFRFWACLIGMMALVIGVWWLSKTTDLLRDVGPSPEPANGRIVWKPYSLARWQMAVWFVLVVTAFLYIWISTGATDTITATVLGLIGIGAGTALGAAVIDSGTTQDDTSRLTALEVENASLTQDIATIEGTVGWQQNADLRQQQVTKTLRRADVQKDIAQVRALSGPHASRGWLQDLLADTAGGYSFHRFQMFVWTIVLVLLFLHSVWARLSMPEFSGTLLALMGISGGTYLGFKIPENSK